MSSLRKLDWYDMGENAYRASQICRILGNPKSFQMLHELHEAKAATTTELAVRLNRDVTTVSHALKTLRQAHLVRYQRDGRKAVYRLKSPKVAETLRAVEDLAAHLRRLDR